MKKNGIGKTAAAFGIVLIFVFGAFAPAVGSIGNTEEQRPSSSVVPKTGEVSLKDSAGISYDNLVNTYLQTAILGVVNFAVNSPLLNQVREFFTGQETSNDVGAKDSGINPIDTVDKTSQEQDSGQLVDARGALPLGGRDSWWNTNWDHRKNITIDHAKVDTNILRNFPVLIKRTDTDLLYEAQPDCDDIVFTDASGNKLNHEIEKYNSTTGELVAWVNVTSLSPSVDTVISMYFGNETATNQQNPSGVWDGNYVMVQHLEESTGTTMYDSTTYGNNGIQTNTTYTNTGKMDGARLYNQSDKIVANNFTHSATKLTAEAWMYRDTTAFIYVLCKGTYSTTSDWMIYLRTGYAGAGIDFRINSGASSIRTGTTYPNTWFYLAATYNSPNAYLYLNGTQIGSSTTFAASINNNYPHLGMGNDYTGRNGNENPMTNVKLDELRVSKIARNSSWIKTSYNTMSSPSTFMTLGPLETRPGPIKPSLSNPIPANESLNVKRQPVCSITVSDDNGGVVNVTFFENTTGSWVVQHIGRNVSVPATVSWDKYLNASLFSTRYWWKVNVSDGTGLYREKIYSFTTTTLETTPPTITLDFAGNPSDSGGPYYLPGTSTPAPEGYYTNDSYQQEKWMYIKCTATDNAAIDEVWLHWRNGTQWTNSSYQLTHTTGNTYELNMSAGVAPGYKYSFDLLAVDTSGNTALYRWLKAGMDTTVVDDRRWVQLGGTPTNISYIPYYLFPAQYSYTTGYGAGHNMYVDDPLHHDQGPDGTLTDTGYLLAQFPTNVVRERYCGMYVGYWFDETVTAVPGTIQNIYQHFWWNTTDKLLTVAYGKYDGGFYRTNNWGQSYLTNTTKAHSNISYNSKMYSLESALMRIASPQSFTDNDIYEFFIEHYTPGSTNPTVINNRSILSFVIFNVPDNTTLQGQDTDYDGLTDYQELYVTYTNPFVQDTDNDGVSDNLEYVFGSDPNNYKSTAAVAVPILASEIPSSGSTDQVLNPRLSITVSHPLNKMMNLTMRTNATGTWLDVGHNFSIYAGTFSQQPSTMNQYNTKYWWSVNCSDGMFWTNKTYWLRTLSDVPIVSNPSPADGVTNVPVALSAVQFTVYDGQGDLMNYTVQTVPNIGSGSASSVSDGTYTVSISGLTYNTYYTWYVNVTDPLGSGQWTRKTYHFTTAGFESTPPSITLNFAGNPNDKGGPYFLPGTSTVAPEGYYTNDSYQQEKWMSIKCTATDNVGIDKVWLHWLNGTYWTNNTYQLTHTTGNLYEINMSAGIAPGYKYSFDLLAVDTSGNTALYRWLKAGADTTVVDNRRYVQLGGTPENISYTPYYLNEANYQYVSGYGGVHHWQFDDPLHHDQGPDGTLTDTGYLLSKFPTGVMQVRQCMMYVGYWFDETVTALPGQLKNIYQHVWWYSNNEQITVAYGKYDGGLYRDQNWGQSYVTSSSKSHSRVSYSGRLYNLEATLMNITSPYSYSDNDIYEFFVEYYTPKEDPQAPWVVNNRSMTSFVIFNVPDNATLQGQDTDYDGLNDYRELYVTFTNPFAADTDGDGRSDYTEYYGGSDPNDYTKETSVIWPIFSMESPAMGSIGQQFNPKLALTVNHPLNNTMNMTFRTNATGSWLTIGQNTSIHSGTYSQITSNMNLYDTRYWWSVNCSDGIFWTNATYWFKTISDKPVVSNPSPGDSAIEVSPLLSSLTFTLTEYQGDAMDYTVTTRPDIGSGSGSGVGNGTYAVALSGLTFNTHYIWYVNATDPLGSGKWTNKTFSFTTRTKILVKNPVPPEGATNISRNPTLRVSINNWMSSATIWWIKTNASGLWTTLTNGTLLNGNGTISANFADQLAFHTKYWWWVEVTDETEWSNHTYSFSTTSEYQFPIKWTNNIGNNYRGVRTIDLNGDGIKDIVTAVNSGLRALNGADGSVLWYTPISGVDYAAQIDVGDLNNDGIPEVVCDVRNPPVGLCAVHGNNGSIYWIRRDFVGGINQACPLILDYDNSGYPHVFSATRDPGAASLNRVSYDGTQLLSVPFTHQCAGGIIGGDYDNDGHFEIYTGNWDPGGMRSYYAENLTLRWNVHYPVPGYAYATSAGEPVLVDYNNDGLKEVFVYIIRVGDGDPDTAEDVTSGYALLSCKDGNIVSANHNIPGMAEHYWTYNQVLYDIDHDGHMEWVVGNQHFIVYDLITQTIKHFGTANAERWSPVVADLTGDGVMDIAVSFGSYFQVYDSHFNNIVRIPKTGYLPGSGTSLYPHATDLDGDGLNELIIDRGDGTVNVIETDGIAKFGGSRAGELGYSSYRQSVSEYVSILDLKNEQPPRDSSNVAFNPKLSVYVADWQDEHMDITFRTNASGTWQNIGKYTNVLDGIYNISSTNMYNPSTTYWWSVNTTDKKNTWTNMTYRFTTAGGTPVAPIVTNPIPIQGAVGVPISLLSLKFNLTDYQGNAMSYAVQTSPNIGTGGGINVYNGTYTIPVSGPLSYNAVYRWFVNVTDGTYWKNETFSFRTQPTEPVLSSEFPRNGATKVTLNPTLRVTINDYQGDAVNWWIKTNASGSWITLNSGTLSSGNGIVSATPTTMNQYQTKYWWSVHATDPSGSGRWTNATYSFTTAIQQGPWWNPSWFYRKEIDLNHSLITGNLGNFPVLIRIDSDFDLAVHAQPNGDDIVFTDYFGNQLNHEIESYQSSTGQLVAWLNVTHLSSTADTILYMYYGSSESGSQENPLGVWDDGFLGIWHLNQSSGLLYDSTSHNYDATNHGAEYFAGAKADGGYDLTPNDYISVADAQPLRLTNTDFTLEGWIYIDSSANSGFITKYFGASPWLGWGLDVSGSSAASFWSNTQGSWVGSTKGSLSIGGWHYITMTFKEKGTTDDILFYFDGKYDSTKQTKNPGDGTATMVFGAEEQGGTNFLNGKIDEIRISRNTRNASWVNTTYNTINTPQTFLSFGSEQERIDAPRISDPTPADGVTDVSISLSELSFRLTDQQGDTMNYTVATRPNIGSGNGNMVTNGTYPVAASGITFNTQYTWFVNVTDGMYWTNKTFTFTTELQPVNDSPIVSYPTPVDGAIAISISLSQVTFLLNDPEGDLIDYIVQTSPNIGGKSESGVGNGTKTVSISGLAYSTTYRWFVNATDPSGSGNWTRQVYSFTTMSQPGVHKFSVNHTSHIDYGLAYPVTYIFTIPPGLSNLKAYKQYPGEDWVQIPTKTNTDLFSGVEAVRFGYTENKAYVSVAFPAETDDVYLMITDTESHIISALYQEIAPYYDNRSTAVVITSDDWLTCPGCALPDPYSTNVEFKKVCDACQARNIWYTPGINSNGTIETGWYPNPDYGPNWTIVQQEVSEGYIELAAHSRNHPSPPYTGPGADGYDGEIGGCKQDILNNVSMNPLNRRGSREYLYTWIEPYGQSDATVRQKLGQYKYICDRSTVGGYTGFAPWDATNGLYSPAGYTLVWDSANTAQLNSAFDSVHNAGGIYLIYGHPFRLDLSPGGHVYQHLNYLANRSDVWYAGMGHLYLYHYMDERNVITHSVNYGNMTPLLTAEVPNNGSTNNNVGSITLQITASDPEHDQMNLLFLTNSSGSWVGIGTNTSVSDGIYRQVVTYSAYNTTYWWSVHATDPSGSGRWTNRTYQFKTKPLPVNNSPVITNPTPANGSPDVPLSFSELTFLLSDPEGDLMDYTVETSPNIGGASEHDVGNGIKTVSISGLAYSTTYHWFINTTDPGGSGKWTNRSFSFTTQAEPGVWWNSSWLYRKTILLNHSMVNEDLTNFPVLINIGRTGDSDLVAHAQPDGDDFVFTDYYGNTLNHEIDWYNSSLGWLLAWVKVTHLSASQDTILYLYYGNLECGSQQNPPGVWDSNYRMVQHFKETSGTIHHDSTSYWNNGSCYNGVVMNVAGIIGSADRFNGTNNYVEVPNSASLGLTTVFTIEGWIKPSSPQSGLNKQPFNKPDCYVYSYQHSNELYRGAVGVKTSTSAWPSPGGPVTVTENTWHYVTGVYDGAYLRTYIDGVQKASSYIGSVTLSTNTWGFLVGAGRSTTGYMSFFDGIIDEVRVSAIARNSSWITTEYNVVNSSNAFSTVGSEEEAPPETIWDVTLSFSGPNGANDALIFGERPDASDNLDSYDVPKPGSPPSPCVYAWFRTNFSEPYNRLMKEYKHYPDVSKMWEMRVLWDAEDSANITLSWDPASLPTEYLIVLLKDVDSSLTTNMHTVNHYTFNASAMSTHHFQILCTNITEQQYTVHLDETWNLISLPIKESVPLENITVNYLGTNYTWQEAVDNLCVLGAIYGWDTSIQNYFLSDTLNPGYGYWMYAYGDCDLWITSTPSSTNDTIANLLVTWNLIGLPYDMPVEINDLIVSLDGTNYTWQEAVDNLFVLGAIYGWVASIQNYFLSDTLNPGYGYWMYAYDACVLKKGGS